MGVTVELLEKRMRRLQSAITWTTRLWFGSLHGWRRARILEKIVLWELGPHEKVALPLADLHRRIAAKMRTCSEDECFAIVALLKRRGLVRVHTCPQVDDLIVSRVEKPARRARSGGAR